MVSHFGNMNFKTEFQYKLIITRTPVHILALKQAYQIILCDLSMTFYMLFFSVSFNVGRGMKEARMKSQLIIKLTAEWLPLAV